MADFFFFFFFWGGGGGRGVRPSLFPPTNFNFLNVKLKVRPKSVNLKIWCKCSPSLFQNCSRHCPPFIKHYIYSHMIVGSLVPVKRPTHNTSGYKVSKSEGAPQQSPTPLYRVCSEWIHLFIQLPRCQDEHLPGRPFPGTRAGLQGMTMRAGHCPPSIPY